MSNTDIKDTGRTYYNNYPMDGQGNHICSHPGCVMPVGLHGLSKCGDQVHENDHGLGCSKYFCEDHLQLAGLFCLCSKCYTKYTTKQKAS